jgi:hypothetical protein
VKRRLPIVNLVAFVVEPSRTVPVVFRWCP